MRGRLIQLILTLTQIIISSSEDETVGSVQLNIKQLDELIEAVELSKKLTPNTILETPKCNKSNLISKLYEVRNTIDRKVSTATDSSVQNESTTPQATGPQPTSRSIRTIADLMKVISEEQGITITSRPPTRSPSRFKNIFVPNNSVAGNSLTNFSQLFDLNHSVIHYVPHGSKLIAIWRKYDGINRY